MLDEKVGGYEKLYLVREATRGLVLAIGGL
jgi:hypothetical protein